MSAKKIPATWVRVSDTLTWHRKTLIAGNEAMGLWVRALSYCGQQMNNGRVPREIVPAMGASFELADKLVEAGFWTVTDAGWAFDGWDEWQSTREEIDVKRQANAERVARYRANKRTGSADEPASDEPAAAEQLLVPDDEGGAVVDIADGRRSPYSPLFERWYATYPRKVGKGAAFKAFERARKAKTLPDIDELVQITERYAIFAKTLDPQFIPHPSTWLNEARYDDEQPQQQAVGAAPVSSRLMEWLEARGVTLDEYNSRKSDGAWLDALKQKGI